jgi:hypothetical protein
MAGLFEENGLAVASQEYVSGIVSQQLTNAMRLLSRANAVAAWAAVFPLRVFQVFDPMLTNLISYPYLSIAVVGVKQDTVPAGVEGSK